MAKGNMLLGKSRGSVGDVTFSQINGQQIAKARNRNPANPRTLKQCFQRGRFAAAVKFYTRGTQALYKFAFENKRQTESDYNAFMRENVKIAPAISKAAFDNYDYPVIAPFIMSKGSLSPVNVIYQSSTFIMPIRERVGEETMTTIGQLSTALLANEAYQVGDIMTFVVLESDYSGDVPDVTAEGSGKTTWVIKQFIIDPDSTDTIVSVLEMTVNGYEIGGTPYLALTLAENDYQFTAATAIHSRNTAQGLKVSTQELVLSSTATTAYNNSQADAHKEAVAVSWRTAGAVDMQPDAILQGSIAYGD